MDRIIEVKVGGNYLSKDNKNAGVRGEANVTKLRIIFDEGWDGYAKKVTFWDARGANPVERTLTTDYLENIVMNERVYIIPIPAEPMAEAGMLTFVIDGYVDGKRQRSLSDKLEIKDAPITDSAGEPADPTPTQAEQLQKQIDSIISDIHDAVEAKESIENMSVSAETLSTGEEAFVDKTEKGGVVNLHFGLPAGEKGETGDDGYTPQRGVDYWTEEEKAGIAEYVKGRVGETEDAVSKILEIQEGLINGTSIINLLGAAPFEHTHTAEDVGAASWDHSHTPGEIGAAQCEEIEVAVDTLWETNPSGGYKQTIDVPQITLRDNPIVDVVLGTDVRVNKLYLEAWGLVDRITTANGSITLYAYSDVPETDFIIQLKVVC